MGATAGNKGDHRGVAIRPGGSVPVVILICAEDEWKAVCRTMGVDVNHGNPFAWFAVRYGQVPEVVFLMTGCGKVAAAAGTQHAIDRWHPELLLNLGTCGGFEGCVAVGDILVVGKATAYDMHERGGNAVHPVGWEGVTLPVPGCPERWPSGARIANIASADQDLDPESVPRLRQPPFEALAADWESAAVAWVADTNNTWCQIIRGVSDVVGDRPSPEQAIQEGSAVVMAKLLHDLPAWLQLLMPAG